MANEPNAETQRSQKTKPRKGKAVDIPIPTKRDVLRDLTKIAKHGERNDKAEDG